MYNNFDYCTQDEKIANICSKEYDFFLSKENVVGVALGYKIKNGFYTNEKCIKIFVVKKIPCCNLDSKNLVPSMYKGVKTDIVSSGPFKKSSLTHRIRPVLAGYSIGPCTVFGSGSMGCLVKDSSNNIYVLSNNHVLSDEGSVPLQTPIIQPSAADGGIVYRDTIANLSKVIPLKYSTTFHKPANYVDCAIAKVTNHSLVSSQIALIGSIRGVSVGTLNQSVEKVGLTTELTEGDIVGVSSTIKVDFGKGKLLFKNQLVASKMSEGGDSGSCLLNLNGEIVGLIWGQSQSFTSANTIQNVLSSLNVSVVTNI